MAIIGLLACSRGTGRLRERAFLTVASFVLAGAIAGCHQPQASAPAIPTADAAVAPQSQRQLTLNFAPNDAPGEWRSQARDYANTRYSALEQVNTEMSHGSRSRGRSPTALGTGTKPPHSCSTTRCI